MSFTLLDGGMGKLLESQGAPFRQPEWSALALMEAPEEVTKAHAAFVEAGADLLTTSNYAVVPFHIGDDRFAADGADLTALAGRLARLAADAAGRPITVAGSIPPVFGSYRPQSFRPDLAPGLLATIVNSLEPFVDLWICETQSSIEEALASLEAASGTGKPVWVSFTLADGDVADPATLRPGETLRSGETVGDAVAAALDARADAVLFNCSQPEVMRGALDQAAVLTAGRVPIGCYANTFDHDKPDGWHAFGSANEDLHTLRHDIDEARYRRIVEGWIEAGASIVGGCCGIMPTHIAEIARLRTA